MCLLKLNSVEELIENLRLWELSDVHGAELYLESSLEPYNIQKRKFTDNNESTSKDSRKKLQVRNVQTTANAGTQTLELVAESVR